MADCDFDLIVLGAGATGLGAARTGRNGGRSVALVEAERPGGDCTHFGCIPSKALLETARRVQAARSGPAYGFKATVRVDFPKVMQRVTDVISEVEQDESPELLRREGIELLTGFGVFTGAHTIAVDGQQVTAKRFVIASGSKAAVPPIEGLADVPYLDNKNIFALREQPEHLLVLGGGPIGLELAQAFRRLGSKVTVVEGMAQLLGREEPGAAKAITTVLAREGVVFRLGAKVEKVSAGPTLHLSDGTTISGSHLLVAVGRVPNTEGIGLDALGVELDRRRIKTDKHLRAAKTAWAAGDCTSPLQFTHVGDEQGRLAARNAFARRPGSWNDRVVPWVTFTEPEVAHVGLTESQAVERWGSRILVSTVKDTRSDRARTAGETDGFTTIIARKAVLGGVLFSKPVGMTVVGPMAGEQIAEGALAMQSGMLLGRMAQTIHAYPTWSLSTRVAAARFFGTYGGSGARAGKAVAPPP